MATNKHAIIRYQSLDKCFSNWGRKYFIDDLIERCNLAIYDYTGIEDGVKRRHIFDDTTDWETFFADFVGVTKTDNPLTEVKLLFTKEQVSYILTKPLHQTQKTKLLENGRFKVGVEVINGYYLIVRVLEFSGKIGMVSPQVMKERLKERLSIAYDQY